MKTALSSLWRTSLGHPVRAFGSVSLLLLISLAIAPAKNYFSEWRHYQKQYLALIRSRGEAVTYSATSTTESSRSGFRASES